MKILLLLLLSCLPLLTIAQTNPCLSPPGIVLLNDGDSVAVNGIASLRVQGCDGLPLWYLKDPTGSGAGKAVEMGASFDFRVPADNKEKFIPVYAACVTDSCTSPAGVFYLKTFTGLSDDKEISSTSSDRLIPVIPPSPNAASLGKYAEVPVSYYTGLPQTDIPIYTVQDQDINVPISMSYHHGGVRVEEEASWVGLGWTLNAGGVVTRTIRGGDDLNESWGHAFNVFPQNFVFGSAGNDPAVLAYYQKYRQYQNELDTQPDLFYYNVGGVAGKFVIKGSSTNTFPLEGIPLDRSNVKIKCYKVADRNYRWEIITENGMTYNFQEQEVTASANSSTTTAQYHEKTGTYTGMGYNNASTKVISTWYLSNITSAKTAANVTFEYYNDKIYTSTSRLLFSERYKTLEAKCANSTGNCQLNCVSPIGVGTGSVTNATLTAMQNKYLKAIVFKNGRVEFTTEQREDIQPLKNGSVNANFPFADVFGQNYGEVIVNFPVTVPTDGTPQRVKKVTVKDKSNNQIKNWEFQYSYFDQDSVDMNAATKTGLMRKFNYLRLRLDRMGELDTAGEVYNFTYVGDGTSPVVLASKVSPQRDLFGYYNGAMANYGVGIQVLRSKGYYPLLGFNTFDPAIPTVNGFFYIDGSDRDIDETYKVRGALKGITYPNGGSRNFDYASHVAIGGRGDVDRNSYNNFTSSSFLLSDATDTYFEFSVKGNCSGPTGGTTNCPSQNTIVAQFSNGTISRTVRFSDLISQGCTNPATGITSCAYEFKYPLTVATTGSYSYNALVSNFSMDVQTYRYHRSDDRPTKMGGLRVREIITDDANGTVAKRTFDYSTATGGPSGVQLTTLLKYSYGYLEQLGIQDDTPTPYTCKGGAFGIILPSSSLAPLGSALGGNHVGYGRVVERATGFSGSGNNGYTVHEFLNQPLTNARPYSYFADAPQFPSYGNGMPTTRTTYDQSNAKVAETIYSPTLGKTSVTVKGLLITLGGTASTEMFVNPFYYDVRSEFWYNPTVTSRSYTNGSYAETVERQVYDLDNDRLQLKEKWTTAPDAIIQNGVYDKWHKTAYSYPYNFTGNAAMTNLVGGNRLDEVIAQKQSFVGWNGTSETSSETLFEERLGYGLFNTRYLPANREIKYENGTWQPLMTYNAYDASGNMTQYTARTKETTYLSYYGTEAPGRTNLPKSRESDNVATPSLRPLQKQLFDYAPLRGINKVTQPNGLSASYAYDNLSRLSTIRDAANDLTQKFTYQYANGCPALAAPAVSASTGLCSVGLTASGCSGLVQWSNGATGSTISVPTHQIAQYTATCVSGACSSPASNSVRVPDLAAGWQIANIANSPAACVQPLSTVGSYNIKASGLVNNLKDSIQFVYRELTGNFTAYVKINSLPATPGNRSGIMIRSSLAPDAQMLTIYQDGNANVGVNRRAVMGFMAYKPSPLDVTWVKMTKVGNDLRVYYSTDSNPQANGQWKEDFAWQSNNGNPTTINFGSTFYVGLAVWGNNNQTGFTNFSLF